MMNKLDPDEMPKWLSSLWPSPARDDRILIGINEDDCAVLDLQGQLLLVTTDFLNARPIALELGVGTNYDLGRLVVAANLSDLCSCGAEPVALLIAIMMERKANEHEFKQVIKGIEFETKRWGVPVIGGDTKLGDSTNILGIALGSAPYYDKLFLRNRAEPGDLIWVSGNIGSCSAAVLGLSRNDMKDNWMDWAKEVLTVPQIPLAKSRNLYAKGIGKGGIDISDGLGADLFRLCEASGVGAEINVENLPIAPEAQYLAKMEKIPAWSLPFGTGGDFQFIVTTDSKYRDQVSSLGFCCIGRIVLEKRFTLLLKNGEPIPMSTKGHRDARNMTFSNEIRSLIGDTINGLEESY